LRLCGADWEGVRDAFRLNRRRGALPLSTSDWHDVAAAIHSSGFQFVVAVTGGGSGAISTLLETPGASRSVLAAVVPYSLAALTDWVGGKPEQACSASTARAMAMKSFRLAGTFAGRPASSQSASSRLTGFGLTASLATNRPKRGERRIHAAVQMADRTEAYSLTLVDEAPTRAADERVAAGLLLLMIAAACGVDATAIREGLPLGDSEELLTHDAARADEASSDLLQGRRRMVLVEPTAAETPASPAPHASLVFPGAFNPPHRGHLRMAALAETRLQQRATWELSIANVDKPPLDFIAIRDRVNDLR
jgi:hypothetical protein